MRESENITLLELIGIQMRKNSNDELSRLDCWEKKYLAGLLESIDANLPPLSEWNRIIRITTNGSPRKNCIEAKTALISSLRGA